ncbi:MAG: hypothetical protein ACOCZB_02685 [Spirochaetota bacterium]
MRGAWRLAVLGLLLVPGSATADPNPEIAGLYRDAAYEAYVAGEFDRAVSLAEIAAEFAQDRSDSHYVRGLALSAERALTLHAIDAAEAAIELDRWERFEPLHGRVLLGRLYNRVQRPDEAADLLRTAEERPDTPARLLSEYYYQLSYALHELDRDADRDRVLAPARDAFPNDPRFYSFYLRSEPFPSAEHRRELERLLDVAEPSDRPAVNELVYRYALAAPTESELAWALGQLRDGGWNDPAEALLIGSGESEAAVDVFLERDGFTNLGVYRRLRAIVDEPARLELQTAAGRFTGTSLHDTDDDGVWNERLTVSSGLVRRWERDADQDGRTEIEVEFGERFPQTVILRDADATVRLRFGQYPFVREAEVEVDGGREVFALRPRTLRYPVVESLPAAGPGFGSELSVADDMRGVERSDLVAGAIRIDLVRPDGTIAERSLLQGDSLRRTYRDDNGDGAWDHLLLNRGGFAVSGVRDLDGDGYHEVAEGYRDGRLVALAVDSNHDGHAELFEREDGISVREWDVNGDGRIDVREFTDWTDRVLREFPLAGQER